MIAWPDNAPKYNNACTDYCDAWEGICACGATHEAGEFYISYWGNLYRNGKLAALAENGCADLDKLSLRELDLFVAEFIVGNLTRTRQHPERGYVDNAGALFQFEKDPRKVNPDWTHVVADYWATSNLPEYSKDLNQIMPVLQAVCSLFTVSETDEGVLVSNGFTSGHADTLAQASCLLALKSVRWKMRI